MVGFGLKAAKSLIELLEKENRELRQEVKELKENDKTIIDSQEKLAEVLSTTFGPLFGDKNEIK